MSWLDRVGVELEGGWSKLWPFGKGVHPLLTHDDSLPASLQNKEGKPCQHAGEAISPPLLPGEIGPWVTAHYPDATSDRCGIHVHMSLKDPQAYSLLGSLSFYEFFLKEWAKWGKEKLKPGTWDDAQFAMRLSGKNKYCTTRMDPGKQMQAKTKDEARLPVALSGWGQSQLRRTQLNFPYGMLKTVESRLLPTFTQEALGTSAVLFQVNMVERWLDDNFATFARPQRLRIVVTRKRKE